MPHILIGWRVDHESDDSASGYTHGALTKPNLAGARIVVAVTVPRSAAFFAGQLSALRREGVEVHVITSPSDEVAAQCAEEGATFVPIEMQRDLAPGEDVRAFSQIARALRRIRPDLANAGTPKAGLLVMTAARIVRVPWRVQTLHGLRFETARGLGRAAIWTAQRLSCAAATHVVCVSPSVRERAIKTHLVSATRAFVLGDGTVNGIDLDRFRRSAATRSAALQLRAALGIDERVGVVGYVGRIAHDKGVAELAGAWTTLAASGAHLVVCGDLDPTDPPDPKIVEALHAAPRVHFLGHADPVGVFAAIDVLVLPTHREGMPTAPLEAGAMGLPVVATRVTGCVDAIVDGVTGTLVEIGNPVALAAALRRYLDDEDLRRSHGAAARARVAEQFSRARVHALTLEFYRSILC